MGRLAVRRERESRRRPTLVGNCITAFTWVWVVVIIMPVLWMVITSFRSESSAYGTALLFRPTLSEYKAVLTGGLVPFLVDSVVAGVGSSVVVLLLAVPVAYVLVFNRVSHARDILTWLLSFCTAPAMAMVIPAYILACDLHLLDHVQVLDIMYALMNFPIAVWILWSFCRDLPRQLVDVARLTEHRNLLWQ